MLISVFDSTFEILSVPSIFPTFDIAVTLAFNSSFVTGVFWFTTISFPATSYSSLSAQTFTATLTASLLPSGYVTVTTPTLSPGPCVVLGFVSHV